MKVCKDCGFNKPLSEFYKHPLMTDGHLGSCKECRRSYARQHRADDPEVRDRDNARSKTTARREHLRANAKRWIEKHPERYRAHNAANNAIRDGKLKRKRSCEKCGSRKSLHKHHVDYSRPLDVIWLCARCHALEKF